MLYCFNYTLFKVAYSMLCFFTVALLISAYWLSMFSFLGDIVFHVVLFIYFLDNTLLYNTLIKNSYPLSSPKEFLYQLVFLVTNW